MVGLGPQPVFVGLVTAYMAFGATSLYLHRSLAHRSVDFAPWLAAVFRVIIWALTGIDRHQWVAVHRRHHAVADTDDDPHGPARFGYWTIQFLSIIPYRRATRDARVFPRLARGIPVDGWDRLFGRGWLGVGLAVGVTAALAGPLFAGATFLVHVLGYFVLQGLVNALCHTRLQFIGSAPWFVARFEPTNRPWIALATLGEGLHANHHMWQSTARMSRTSGEVDLGWALIRLIARGGQAFVRRPAQAEPQALRIS